MYKNLYVLTKPMNDEVHSVLNGRVFSIYTDQKGHCEFVLLGESIAAVSSTHIEKWVNTTDSDHFLIKTSSGTEYEFQTLGSALPTAETPDDPNDDKIYRWDPILGMVVIRSTNVSADGTTTRLEFTLNKVVSRQAFVGFLQRIGQHLIKKSSPTSEGMYTRVATDGGLVWSWEMSTIEDSKSEEETEDLDSDA